MKFTGWILVTVFLLLASFVVIKNLHSSPALIGDLVGQSSTASSTSGDTTSSVPAGFMSVLDYGMTNDNNNSSTNRTALLALFAANPNGKIYFPAGNYLIANPGNYPLGATHGDLIINNFNGTVEFQPGARLVMTDDSQGGLSFHGGISAQLINVRIAYASPPPVRDNNPALAIYNATDTYVQNAYIEDSPGAGILFNQVIRPVVSGVQIIHSMSDGVHFANDQDPSIEHEVTTYTGDDGLAFLSYATLADNTGGTASDIHINNSLGRGITAIGQSDVVVSNFTVSNTRDSGILVGQDPSYDTRYPSNVTMTSGTISGVGSITTPPPAGIPPGPTYGIQFDYPHGSTTFSNIQITGGTGAGVSGIAPSGTVAFDTISITGAKNDGIDASAQGVNMDNVSVNNVGGSGMDIYDSGIVTAKKLALTNVSTASSLHRALWLESNHNIAIDGIEIIDNQATSTGYSIGETYNGSGTIEDITYNIVHGKFVYRNLSPGVTFGSITNIGSAPPPTTPTSTPPFAIKSITVSEITENSARVTVTTNASSSVAIGYTSIGSDGTVQTPSYLTTTYVDLGNLDSGTMYSFHVLAIEASGTQVSSGGYTFTTLSPPISTGGGGGGGGGTGGGGGSYALPPRPSTTSSTSTVSITAPTTTPSVASSSSPLSPSTPAVSQPLPFPRTLKMGDTGSDVVLLQDILKTSGFLSVTIPSTGYFGTATQHALMLFQGAHDLAITGSLTPQSQDVMNKVAETEPSVLISQIAPSSTLPATPSETFSTRMGFGSSGPEVKALQTFLVQDDDYPEAIISGYYGSLTEKAVQTFQSKYGIVSYGAPNTTGYGSVGPRTLVELNALSK